MSSAGEPIPIGDDHAHVVPSIGIVVLGEEPAYEGTDLSPMGILRRADAAMYEAKRNKLGPVIAD